MENGQLKLLMDYTIFHLGVYLTFAGLMVSLLSAKWFPTSSSAQRF
jgi:hypothetical protein